MKHKDKIKGIEVISDDGDKNTDDVTELYGEFCEQANEESIKFAIDLLKGSGCDVLEFETGYMITKPSKKATRHPNLHYG